MILPDLKDLEYFDAPVVRRPVSAGEDQGQRKHAYWAERRHLAGSGYSAASVLLNRLWLKHSVAALRIWWELFFLNIRCRR